LARFEHIDVVVFSESTILKESPAVWPHCDAFLSFYSNGFPLEKAIAYAELRKPFLINDIEAQLHLQDRQKVHETLEEAGVELPRYAVLIRDPLHPDDANIVEHDDWIEIEDQIFHKPFVEKPLSAEDHNVRLWYLICIYLNSKLIILKKFLFTIPISEPSIMPSYALYSTAPLADRGKAPH
jgi:inositol hexakisphosphate/diphosphoinositol-pentakisphosphate kinase